MEIKRSSDMSEDAKVIVGLGILIAVVAFFIVWMIAVV